MLDVESPWRRLLCSLIIAVVLLGSLTGAVIAIIFSLGAVKEPGSPAKFKGPGGFEIEIAKLEKKLDALTVLVERSNQPAWPTYVNASGNLFGGYNLTTVHKFFEANDAAKQAYFKWAKEAKLPTGFRSKKDFRDQFPKEFWDNLPKEFRDRK
jgi:hypothetical protein